ncbi:hypothetical protein SFC43_08210 [Bacteroides sp. CR5/BHMF/2]|nr:hypothetical protein [Bacteroides sp. CR5/BHMF/2]
MGRYVLAALATNIAVIIFLSVTQGLLFEVILPGNPDPYTTAINVISGLLTIGFLTAGSTTISLFTHWLRYNLRIDELRVHYFAIRTDISQESNQSAFPFQYAE